MPNAPDPTIVFGLTLMSEMYTASELLTVGLNRTLDPDWRPAGAGSAFTCMASGVERILKLTYGASLLDAGQPFPDPPVLRRLGHDLVALDGWVHPDLANRAARPGKGYVSGLLDDVAQDPYWAGLLVTLNAWADSSGRYRDLDRLAGTTPSSDPPWAMWESVERRCLADLGLMSQLSGEHSQTAIAQGRQRLALSVLGWWHALYRAWTHGLLGDERRSAGTALNPRGSGQLAPALAMALAPH